MATPSTDQSIEISTGGGRKKESSGTMAAIKTRDLVGEPRAVGFSSPPVGHVYPPAYPPPQAGHGCPPPHAGHGHGCPPPAAYPPYCAPHGGYPWPPYGCPPSTTYPPCYGHPGGYWVPGGYYQYHRPPPCYHHHYSGKFRKHHGHYGGGRDHTRFYGGFMHGRNKWE